MKSLSGSDFNKEIKRFERVSQIKTERIYRKEHKVYKESQRGRLPDGFFNFVGFAFFAVLNFFNNGELNSRYS